MQASGASLGTIVSKSAGVGVAKRHNNELRMERIRFFLNSLLCLISMNSLTILLSGEPATRPDSLIIVEDQGQVYDVSSGGW